MGRHMESFIYFFLGLVASIVINLATPSIQKYLEGTKLVNKGKRIKVLKDELEQTIELHTNASLFTATIMGDTIAMISILAIITVLGFLAIFIQSVAIQIPNFDYFAFLGAKASTPQGLREFSFMFHQAAWIPLYLAFLTLGVFATFLIRISNKIRKVRRFKQYKQEIEERIQKLESIKPKV